MSTFLTGTTVDKTYFQPGELVTIYLALCNVNSIFGFTSILTVVWAKTIMLWLFPTASKKSPVHIICLILTTLKNKQHTCKHLRFDKYGALENSIYVTNLLVGGLNIYTKTTGGYASWFNVKNERHNRSIHTMVREVLLDSNQHANK